MRSYVVALALAAVPSGMASAHPHIFIDAGLDVIFDPAGKAVGVRVTWSYDDFYSLLTLEDRQLDTDGDGVLTAPELARLQGFDMNWDADFAGDLHVLMGEDEIALSRPMEATASYEGGRITSTHLRRFGAPVKVGAEPLILQVYDPGYYTAYEITGRITLTAAPARCHSKVFEPDRAVADARLQAALDEIAGSDAEVQFPAVGAAYADEMRVTCPEG